MFDTIVVATDGSDSVGRAVDVAIELAVDDDEGASSPAPVREEHRTALIERGEHALASVCTAADEVSERLDVTTAVREGNPGEEVVDFADEVDATLVVTGTRGRHGEDRFLIGSVAETVVRTCPVPVLTVRRLTDEDPRRVTI